MSFKTIIFVGVGILIWLAVLYALRFTAAKFKGKRFGKAAAGLFKTILSVTPHLIANLFKAQEGGDDGKK